ncbi:Protein of uncharacterised function (DUF2613) [Mycobacterium tuberculosis]|nr:Protein of uncharacterised function (DUF2613) [Mycobacterium tuberculosis]
MNRIVAPAAASVVVGLLLGAAAIFGVTLMVQQDKKPATPRGRSVVISAQPGRVR